MRPSTVGGENFCPWPHPDHPNFKPRPSRLALARINLTAGGRRVYLVSFPFVLPAVAFPTGFLMHPRTDSYFCNIPTFSLLISFSLGLGSWVFFLVGWGECKAGAFRGPSVCSYYVQGRPS